jgi:hypothetical protein
MRSASLSLPGLLIPVFAFLVTVLLGMTSKGAIFATLPSLGKETRVAEVTLVGVEKPKVEMVVVEGERGVWIRMEVHEGILRKAGQAGEAGIEGHESNEWRVEVPEEWHLQEVRGVHVKAIAREKSGEQMYLHIGENGKWKMENGKLEFIFTTTGPFDSLHFSHNSSSPALLKIVYLPSPTGKVEQMAKFVKDSIEVLL